jgi:hypothetical protein
MTARLVQLAGQSGKPLLLLNAAPVNVQAGASAELAVDDHDRAAVSVKEWMREG